MVAEGNPRDTVRDFRALMHRDQLAYGWDQGNREIEIVSAEIFGAGGEAREWFAPGRRPGHPGRPQGARSPSRTPSCRSRVHDEENRKVYETNTDWRGVTWPLFEGKHRVQFVLESLPFIDGRYFVTLGVHSRDARTVYHLHEQHYAFDVVRGAENPGSSGSPWSAAPSRCDRPGRAVRILVVSSYPPRHCGIGAYARDQVHELRAAGHEVTVLTAPGRERRPDCETIGGQGFSRCRANRWEVRSRDRALPAGALLPAAGAALQDRDVGVAAVAGAPAARAADRRPRGRPTHPLAARLPAAGTRLSDGRPRGLPYGRGTRGARTRLPRPGPRRAGPAPGAPHRARPLASGGPGGAGHRGRRPRARSARGSCSHRRVSMPPSTRSPRRAPRTTAHASTSWARSATGRPRTWRTWRDCGASPRPRPAWRSSCGSCPTPSSMRGSSRPTPWSCRIAGPGPRASWPGPRPSGPRPSCRPRGAWPSRRDPPTRWSTAIGTWRTPWPASGPGGPPSPAARAIRTLV